MLDSEGSFSRSCRAHPEQPPTSPLYSTTVTAPRNRSLEFCTRHVPNATENKPVFPPSRRSIDDPHEIEPIANPFQSHTKAIFRIPPEPEWALRCTAGPAESRRPSGGTQQMYGPGVLRYHAGVKSDAATVKAYLAELPPDRRKAIQAVRKVIRANLDKGYKEIDECDGK